jgi:hypothetical protein
MRKLIAVVALSLLAAACQKTESAGGEGDQTAATAQSEAGDANIKMGPPKPGLWEVTTDDGETRDSMRQCITSDASEVDTTINAPAEPGCTKTVKNARNEINVRTVCPNNHVSEAELSVKGSDTQREMVLTLTVSGEKVVQRSTMRHVGACPAGMADGDIQD